MGWAGISPGSLLLILLVVLLLFGTKRVQQVGEDLGHAFRRFKKALEDSSEPPSSH